MNSLSPLVAWLLVLLSLGVAGFFARQQVLTLRGIKRRGNLPPDDVRYYRRRAWRRLFSCALLVAVAVLLSAWYLTGWDVRVDELGDQVKAQQQAGQRQLQPEQEQAGRFYAAYIVTIVLLLLLVLLLAVLDMWATWRYGVRNFRRLRDDRQAMLDRQLAELRRERGLDRNGPSQS